MFNLYENQKWKDEVANKPKLRLYNNIKTNMVVEEYIKRSLTRVERSHMAQLRSGTLKINVELGRMSGLNLQERSCPICKDGSGYVKMAHGAGPLKSDYCTS